MAINFIFPFANLDQRQFINFLHDENSSPIIPLDVLDTMIFNPFSVRNNPEHPDSMLVRLFPQPFPECKYIHPATHTPVNVSNAMSFLWLSMSEDALQISKFFMTLIDLYMTMYK